MLRTLRGEVRPTQAASFPPMTINIERQCTEEAPLSDLIRRFDEVRLQPKVLSNSLMLGFPYADVMEMGSAAIVVTDNDLALARKLAGQLGRKCGGCAVTGRTSDFIPDAVLQIAKLPQPVCLLDMGDNVGGGSPADGTLLAWELHRQRVSPAFVCLNDPAAVQQQNKPASATESPCRSAASRTDCTAGRLRATVTVRAA